jgi:nucleotide-binding universal stress UspA family protein
MANPQIKFKDIEAELIIRRGYIREAIIREMKLEGCDLIIIGSHNTADTLRGAVIPNITMEIVVAARCPVLVIR